MLTEKIVLMKVSILNITANNENLLCQTQARTIQFVTA